MIGDLEKTRTLLGKVVGCKADKTINVLVERMEKHPVYGKYVRRSSKLSAHDEQNECQLGDSVLITPCRPVSKTKSFKLVEISERALRD